MKKEHILFILKNLDSFVFAGAFQQRRSLGRNYQSEGNPTNSSITKQTHTGTVQQKTYEVIFLEIVFNQQIWIIKMSLRKDVMLELRSKR